jgi:hypothetical protein
LRVSFLLFALSTIGHLLFGSKVDEPLLAQRRVMNFFLACCRAVRRALL